MASSCKSPSNGAAARAPVCRCSSAAISTAATLSGGGGAAWAVTMPRPAHSPSSPSPPPPKPYRTGHFTCQNPSGQIPCQHHGPPGGGRLAARRACLTAHADPPKDRRREVSRMQLLTAGVATESNTFAPMPTGLDDYTVFRGPPPEERPTSFTQPFLVWRRLAAERGFDVVTSLGASAPPAGPTVRRGWEDFRDEILRDLRRAMPVGGVLLNTPAPMVAAGYDAAEGDTRAPVRATVARRCRSGPSSTRTAT